MYGQYHALRTPASQCWVYHWYSGHSLFFCSLFPLRSLPLLPCPALPCPAAVAELSPGGCPHCRLHRGSPGTTPGLVLTSSHSDPLPVQGPLQPAGAWLEGSVLGLRQGQPVPLHLLDFAHPELEREFAAALCGYHDSPTDILGHRVSGSKHVRLQHAVSVLSVSSKIC